ncbi:ferrous iron transport protein B [Methanothermococcus sp. SCGC AD-155-C09]|nr:ferrous iron transport protein B [Methanothermococcus sp. SCGC AD-155-C09]
MSKNQKIVGLTGQPNVGKTTLFNALTGMSQRIGNWPGVTVEKKEGILKYKDTEFNIVDLPGIYSLKSDSLDQKIARDFIIENEDSILVDVIDTNNINRNLYLTLQLIELGRSPIVCLNFIDEVEKHDVKLDEKKLSEKLGGLPVIKTSARYKIGIEDLKEAIYNYKPISCEIKYSELLENAIEKIVDKLDEYLTNIDEKFKKVPKRYLALSFLEGDPEVVELFKKNGELLSHANRIKEEIEREIKHDVESYVVEQRYKKADEILKGIWTESIVYDDIDKILLHPIYGFVIFAFIMYILYSFVIGVGDIFIEYIEMFFEYLGGYVGGIVPEPYTGVVVDGIIGGVGGVLVFFPYIAFMMLSLAILEDCGYLSRVTALFHKMMAKIGLSGGSTIPIMVSFGCAVPGLMATRSISDPMKRLITILVAPLAPCAARFVVIGFMATAFFSQYANLFALSILLISLSLMGIIAYLISKFIVKGKPEEPIFELPPYRLPDWNYILKRTWAYSKSFLKRAGTIILAGSILFYYLLNYPNPDNSYGMMLGKMLESITLLMGIDWRGALALIFGIIAKELVVSTLEIAYNGNIVGALTPLKAFVLTLVTVVYIPCLATVATLHYETNNLKWTLFAVGYNLALATTLGIVAYNIGRLLGFS